MTDVLNAAGNKVGEVPAEPVQLSVDQMIEALQAEEITLNGRINDRVDQITRLEQANSQDRARRRVVKRVLTATKPRDRKAPAKKVAAKSG